MATEWGRASPRTRCLQLNALALAFSLTHVIADYGIVIADPGTGEWVMPVYLTLAGTVYGWWGWSLARAATDGRAGLLSLMILSAIWAGLLNGGSLVFTSPAILFADIIHFGSLGFGVWAAYASWRLLQAHRSEPVRATGAR